MHIHPFGRQASLFWPQSMKFCPFWGFGAQKRSFAPKMRPWSPRRKTLYKHNVLEAFLEAQGRKNSFWVPEIEFGRKIKKLHGNSVLRTTMATSAKSRQTSKNATVAEIITRTRTEMDFPNQLTSVRVCDSTIATD